MSFMKPTNITADRTTRFLEITWSDSHTSRYPFTLVRNACPCAECRGGHDNMGSLPDKEIFSIPEIETQATRLISIEAVGSYALTLEWEDGHHYGIYRWDYLRAICPCEECQRLYPD